MKNRLGRIISSLIGAIAGSLIGSGLVQINKAGLPVTPFIFISLGCLIIYIMTVFMLFKIIDEK